MGFHTVIPNLKTIQFYLTTSLLLFELIEFRDLNASLLITSQYPVSVWHESFQDSTIADSVLDRIVHNAHQIEFKKGSIRRMLNEKREE